MTALRAHGRALLLAGRFLTRAPLPDPGAPGAGELGRAALYYPLIGLLLGALLVTLGLLFGTAPTPALAAALLFIWVWGTGGLHLDGLADCADAWVGGLGSRERTFAILADPRCGAMGVVALVMVLISKFAALSVLVAAPGGGAWLALLWIPALARAQLLLLALTTPYARPAGMGAALRHELPRRAAFAVLGLTWTLALGGLVGVAGPSALVLGLAAALVLITWRRSVLARLGGFTGDAAGALVEITETTLLLTLALGS